MVTLDDGTTMPFIIGGGSQLAPRGPGAHAVRPRGAAEGRNILVHPQVDAGTDDDAMAGMAAVRDGRVRARHGGFTLIELMVALAVLAILVALAVPNFNDATLSARLNGFANSLVAAAQVARSEAIKRNETIRLCASSGGATPTCDAAEWEEGWIVVTDDDSGAAAPAGLADGVQSHRGRWRRRDSAFRAPSLARRRATLDRLPIHARGNEERVVTISGTGSAYVSHHDRTGPALRRIVMPARGGRRTAATLRSGRANERRLGASRGLCAVTRPLLHPVLAARVCDAQ